MRLFHFSLAHVFQDHRAEKTQKVESVVYTSTNPKQWAEIHGPNSCKLASFYLHIALSRVNGCLGPALSVWGPALSRSLCRAPPVLSVSGPALSVSGPGALCVEARRSPCPALSVSGSLALCVGICVGRRRSPAALWPRRSLCRALCRILALCVSGRRHSLCRAAALSVSGPGALFVGPCALCVGPCHSATGPAKMSRCLWASGPQLRSAHSPAQIRMLAIGPRAQVPEAPTRPHPQPPAYPCGTFSTTWHALPRNFCCEATHPVRRPLRATRLQLCHPSSSADPICAPPIRSAHPQLRSACHPSAPRAPSSDPCATHPARRVHFFQEKTPNFTVWGKG